MWSRKVNSLFLADSMSEVVSIDGSQGEGGGQILRSSLALAMLTGKDVEISHIRAGREKPGLMRQHLVAVQAAQQISGARVEGAEIGSSHLRFQPGNVTPGNYTFSIGTAGSATLVFQTVLPPLLVADGPSRLILEGGTHNPWAPPFDFLERAFLPIINRMGPRITARIERYGFYPVGGGRVIVDIEPAGQLRGFDLLERGRLKSQSGRVLLSGQSAGALDSQIAKLVELTGWPLEAITHQKLTLPGPASAILLDVEFAHVREVFIGIGEKKVAFEETANRVVSEMTTYQQRQAPVGEYLADQLLLPLAISAWQSGGVDRQRGGTYQATEWSLHSRTNVDVVQAFLDVDIRVTPSLGADANASGVQVQVLPQSVPWGSH